MILGLIPSRLNSSRLKEKPLLEIDKLPLIVHTLKRAMLSKKLDKVIVCTDSEKIVDTVKKHGGEAVMTSPNHKNGTERIAEVAKNYKAKLIVDIQGDEPLVNPFDIDMVIDFHKENSHFDIVVPCVATENSSSPHVIKVIKTLGNKILYFSRAQVPYVFRKIKPEFYFKDLSIISFHPDKLIEYSKLQESSLEATEGIELNRALENDFNLGTLFLKSKTFSVDINEDLMKTIDLMPKDKIRKLY